MTTLGALGSLSNVEDLDLTSVSTDYPVIKGDSLVPCRILKSSAVPVKSDATRLNWVIEMETLVPTESTQNKPIPAGHKLTHNVGLSVTEKRTQDNVLADVCRVLDALFETREGITLSTFDITSIEGGEITVRTSVEPEKDGWPEKNRLRLVKRGQ